MVDKVDKKNIRKKELEKLEIPESGEDVCVWGGGGEDNNELPGNL